MNFSRSLRSKKHLKTALGLQMFLDYLIKDNNPSGLANN